MTEIAKKRSNSVGTMKAADASNGRDDIRIIDIPKPSSKPGEVVVQVECSAVEEGEGQVLKKTLVGNHLDVLHRRTNSTRAHHRAGKRLRRFR